MKGQFLHSKLEEALKASLSFSGHRKQSHDARVQNSIRSSYFCDQVGEKLSVSPDLKGYCRRQINVDKLGNKKKGEWLLDAIWCENTNIWDAESEGVFPISIQAALECESNVGERAFFIDFSKLVNIRRKIKIFLGGVNQKTRNGLCEYIQKRKKQAENFIIQSRAEIDSTEWFLAFWPTPAKPKNSSYNSLWDELSNCPDVLSHLNRIYVFEFIDSHFVEISNNSK